jgi:hypothetical protein
MCKRDIIIRSQCKICDMFHIIRCRRRRRRRRRRFLHHPW